MAKQSHLGIFLGETNLYIVKNPSKNLSPNPHNFYQLEIPHKLNDTLFDSDELATILKNSFSSHQIIAPHISLSLPTADFIFRSFIIPWVQENQLKEVIEFEAMRYLPFPLNELSFIYQATPFTEGKLKHLRIIFIAIRKVTLERYLSIFKRLNINVQAVEAAPISLIRALTSKQLIPTNQTIGLINGNLTSGQIIILTDGLPLFVKEFYIKEINAIADKDEHFENYFDNFINEIKVSLDYFNRQYRHLRVKEIVLLTDFSKDDFKDLLEKDLALSVSIIDRNTIISDPTLQHPGFFNALGSSLEGNHNELEDLSIFSEKKTNDESSKKEKKPIEAEKKISFILGLICVLAIGANILYFNHQQKPHQEKLKKAEDQLGSASSLATASIKSKIKASNQKLENIKSIRHTSNITPLLVELPGLLPKEIWLKNIKIEYLDPDISKKKGGEKSDSDKSSSKSKILMDLTGHVYSKDFLEQFGILTQFPQDLKKNKEFSKRFETITLENVKAENLQQFNLTTFTIHCR